MCIWLNECGIERALPSRGLSSDVENRTHNGLEYNLFIFHLKILFCNHGQSSTQMQNSSRVSSIFSISRESNTMRTILQGWEDASCISTEVNILFGTISMCKTEVIRSMTGDTGCRTIVTASSYMGPEEWTQLGQQAWIWESEGNDEKEGLKCSVHRLLEESWRAGRVEARLTCYLSLWVAS